MTTMTRPGDRIDAAPLYVLGQARLLAERPYPLVPRDRSWLIAAAQRVGLAGRGGAAFPVATKLAAAPDGARVLVNGSEGEPASWKDRILMRHYPDLILDGVMQVAAALHAPRTVIAVTDEISAHALTHSAAQRNAPVEIHLVADDFAAGEIGALANGINGDAPIPDGRRVLPHVRGLDRRPTYASNVETFAQLAVLAALGPEQYGSVGHHDEPGTSLVTVHGHVPNPGVFEAPHGTPLSALVGDTGGRPVLVGGYHGTWTRSHDLAVGRTLMRAQGLGWGAGVLAVLPDTTCPLGEVARVARWLASASAGQCGPCAFGLPAIATDLEDLSNGRHVDLAALRRRLGQVTGRGACHHPTAATGFVASALQVFDADVHRHARGGHCRRAVQDVLPLGDHPRGRA